MEMDKLISARKPDLVLINMKKNCHPVDSTVLVDHKVEMKESEMIEKTWTLPEN